MAAAWHRPRPESFRQALDIAKQLLGASQELVARGVIDTESEQLVLSAHRKATGESLTRLELYTQRFADRYSEQAADLLMVMATSRAEGKLLQHLTGSQVFLDHEYEVGPEALVPRPETELLVTAALEHLDARAPTLGLEVGLGSGIISIELLTARPGLTMIASELQPEAERLARGNARKLLGSGDSRLEVVRPEGPQQVLEPLAARLGTRRADFLISNPPYLISTDAIDNEVRTHEPAAALFAPESDPLFFYRAIAQRVASVIKPGGRVFLELAAERAREIEALFVAPEWDTQVLNDLNRNPRVLIASLKSSG